MGYKGSLKIKRPSVPKSLYTDIDIGTAYMTTNKIELPTISRIKQRAKTLKKERNISHSEALNLISNNFGFKDWDTFQTELKKNEHAKIKTPHPSTAFVADEDVNMSMEDYQQLELERVIDLPFEIKKHIADNKKQLTQMGIEFSIFEPTITGLKKSILDATHPVRIHFELENFHFYWEQGQGPEHKITSKAYFINKTEIINSKASLYRPKTKKGDPRMWFKSLSSFAHAGDQIAIIIKDKIPYLFNLSTVNIESCLTNDTPNEVSKFFERFLSQNNSIANELLSKLKKLAKAPFPALRKGDTAIGYTLETMLGIKANSSKKPDYKGIELKSGRGIKTRTTLFAQVADWTISPCKKSTEILNKYGYDRGEDFKLYCTISTQRENSQGLSFIYDSNKDELQEWHNKSELVAVWPAKLLRDRLKEKHTETFWVEAQSRMFDGIEHFQLINVIHTKSPIISQLLPLLESGVVTMDHLIKRSAKNNKVSEKGPLFKINKRDLDLLFPQPVTYPLI